MIIQPYVFNQLNAWKSLRCPKDKVPRPNPNTTGHAREHKVKRRMVHLKAWQACENLRRKKKRPWPLWIQWCLRCLPQDSAGPSLQVSFSSDFPGYWTSQLATCLVSSQKNTPPKDENEIEWIGTCHWALGKLQSYCGYNKSHALWCPCSAVNSQAWDIRLGRTQQTRTCCVFVPSIDQGQLGVVQLSIKNDRIPVPE